MAKGNPFNGMMRGRIGDTVFSRKFGTQQSRAYVQAVTNPKTTSQSGQRVKFGTIAAFYASAIQNLFKFAFEDKKAGESDYNAFMRLNLPAAVPQTRWAYDNGAPCVGNWLMSKGTLATPLVSYANNQIKDGQASIWSGSMFKAQNHVTLGEVCKALEAHYGYLDGDIVTIVIIDSELVCAQDYDDALRLHSLTEVSQSKRATWTIKQFVLDSKSQIEIDRMDFFELTDQPTGYLLIRGADRAAEDSAAGVAVIVSRPTKRGLKVSTSRIVCNNATENAIAIGSTEAWWRYCAETFNQSYSLKNTPVNILEGSIAANAVGDGIETSVPLPIVKDAVVTVNPGLAVTTLMVTLSESELERLVFVVNGRSMTYKNRSTYVGKQYLVYKGTGDDIVINYEPENQDVYLYNTVHPVTLEKVYLL